MMKRFLWFLICFLGLVIVFSFSAYSQDKKKTNHYDKNYVFTLSLNPYYGLMLDLIGGDFEGVVLIDSFDHHHFDISPNKMKKIKNSDMVFITGTLEIEKELIKTMDPKKVVNFSRYVEVLNEDPHIWVSVKNFLKIIDVMYNYLYSQEKYKRVVYNNYNKVRLKYEILNKELEKLFEKVRKRGDFVYSFHQEFGYLAKDYSIKIEPLFNHEEDLSYKNFKKFIDLASLHKNKKFYLILPPLYDKKIVSSIKKRVNNVVFINFNSNATDLYSEFKKLTKSILEER